MKIRTKIVLGRRKNYPLSLEMECYKDAKNRFYINLGTTLPEAKCWDASRQQVTRIANRDVINNFLRSVVNRVEAADMQLETENRPFSRDYIIKCAKGSNPDGETTVVDKFKEYNLNDLNKGAISLGTYNAYSACINRLIRFIEIYFVVKNHTMTFNEFSIDFLTKLDEYLLLKYSDVSYLQFHACMSKFFKRAKKENLLKYNAYEDLQITRKKSEQKRTSLNYSQLSALENITDEELSAVHPDARTIRDRFLFSCYCGLRLSDNLSLSCSEITTDEDGGLVIEKVTQKSATKVVLPLKHLFGSKPEQIAKRYLFNPLSKNGLLFPEPYRIPKIEAIVSQLGYKINLSYKLTFHVARHTCATMLAEKTANPYVIKSILGHSDIQTSMGYIHNSKQSIKKGLEGARW